jgi:hypothetical protein
MITLIAVILDECRDFVSELFRRFPNDYDSGEPMKSNFRERTILGESGATVLKCLAKAGKTVRVCNIAVAHFQRFLQGNKEKCF